MNFVWRWSVWLLVIGATTGVLLGLGGQLSLVLNAIGYFRPHLGLLAALGGLLSIGLPRRRVKWIGFGAALLAAVFLGPVWRSAERPATPGSNTRTVTVVIANVLGGRNPTLDLTASALLASNADVIAVVEAPRAWAMAAGSLRRSYPYSSVQPGARNGVILFSKFPLQRIEGANPDSETPAFVTATASLGGGAEIGITAVHLSWPLVSNGAQARQIKVLGSLMPVEAGPKLMLGDFNAPPWSEAMSRVERNTSLSMIGGLRRTWLGEYPNPLQYLLSGSLYGREIPAVLGQHIDHVLLSPGIGVDAVNVLPLPGSDHRAVWARLRVPLRVAENLFASR